MPRRSVFRGAGSPDPVWVVLGSLTAGLLMGASCSLRSASLPAPLPTNPLPACPDTANCERVSRTYSVPTDTLYDAAQRALARLGPARLHSRRDALRASAVYRVAWVFRDDVDVAVERRSNGSALHVRSASRVGYSDLGVNRRRVQRLLALMQDEMPPHASRAKGSLAPPRS